MSKKLMINIGLAFLFIVASLCLSYLPQNYLFMLAKSFNVQIMIGYILLGLFLLFRKQWLVAVSCFISASILFIYTNAQINLLNLNSANSPLRVYPEHSRMQRGAVSIAQFNILMYNTNYSATIKSALSTNADLISFQEINQKWASELEANLKEKYPYYKLLPQEDLYGIGIFSKYPLSNINVLHFGKVPQIAANLKSSILNFHFFTIHTRSPETYENHIVRNNQINEVEKYLDSIPSPKFTIGDYNCVPWDVSIINFKKQSQLQDSRKSLCATFPTFFPPAMIPLDYIFYSKDVQCVEFKTVDNGDSDHKGIIGKYLIR